MSTLIDKCQLEPDEKTDQRGHRGNESEPKPQELSCKRFPFWLDGRFIREYLGAQNEEYGRKFVWTDGSKMNYTNWEKRSNYRKTGGCGRPWGEPLGCFGEPQDLPTSLCLHGGVDLIGTVSAKARSAAEERGPRCYTWGNQQNCKAKLPFVCKRASGKIIPKHK